PYGESDEEGWLRCSVLSFLHTAYFDSVFRQKPRYAQPAVELVALLDDTVVGVIDVECEEIAGTICSTHARAYPSMLGGMIWHLTVHPDFQRRGVAGHLLFEAQQRARELGIGFFEAWTRDDPPALRWYESRGFAWIESYLHVYIQGEDEVQRAVQPLV